MSNSFGDVLSEQMGEATLTEIAEEIAGTDGKTRSVLSSLSRFQNGKRTPSRRKVAEIATALGEVRRLSRLRTKQLRDELMRAAGHGDPRYSDLRTAARLERSESEQKERLHPRCREALRTVKTLKEHEIETILDHVGVSTMKLIIAAAERGEEIEVVQLQKISTELQQTAAKYSESVAPKADDVTRDQIAIEAGRARIVVNGEVTPAQMQVLENAAKMIESVLTLPQ